MVSIKEENPKEIVKMILLSGSNVEKHDKKGRNIIMHAAMKKQEYLELLLDLEINLDLQNYEGITCPIDNLQETFGDE